MENQQLQKWALIAEIVGGVAVVVTLMLLVIEVNQNTETLKAATYDSLVADLGEWRLGNARNDSIASVLSKSWEEMTPEEQKRQRDVIVSLFFILERAFIQWDAGNLEERDWERFRRSICGPNEFNFEQRYGYLIDQFTIARFREFRKDQCAN